VEDPKQTFLNLQGTCPSMNLQVQQNMNDQTTTPNTNGVTKSPRASSGSQGAVVQLDDTGRGMSGNIRHPEGCLWKNKQR
jgi:hypothetical protein